MLESKPYYWVVCDGCGANAQEDSDYAAWADTGQAEATAEDADWTCEGGKHWCDGCSSKRANEAEDDA